MKTEQLEKLYGAIVEGPNGKRMPETIARAADAALKKAPREAEMKYHHLAKAPSDIQLDEGARSDVSTITTDDVDREREVVLPDGIDFSQYNKVVTFAHRYDELPVGRCMWIKPKGNGLMAKTEYAKRPADWNDGWLPDAILSLMQQGTCTGKSIGFIPMSYREPTIEEIKKRPEFGQNYVGIIDKCMLLEYAVCPVPCNASAEMIAVSKSLPADVREIIEAAQKELAPQGEPAKEPEPVTPFVTQKTIIDALTRFSESRREELKQLILEQLEDRIAKATGRP